MGCGDNLQPIVALIVELTLIKPLCLLRFVDFGHSKTRVIGILFLQKR